MKRKNFQQTAIDFFGSSCYIMSLSYIYDSHSRDNELVLWSDCITCRTIGACDADGYVRDPVKFVNTLLLDKKFTAVTKVKITSLDDIPDVGMYAVQYARGNTNHFVVAAKVGGKGQIIFDPWGDSNTVKYGKPISYRKFV